MNKRGRSLDRFFPDDYGRTSWSSSRRPQTRRTSLRQVSPGDAGEGYKIKDRYGGRTSYRSRETIRSFTRPFEDKESSQKAYYHEYLREHGYSNYARKIGHVYIEKNTENVYDENYKHNTKDEKYKGKVYDQKYRDNSCDQKYRDKSYDQKYQNNAYGQKYRDNYYDKKSNKSVYAEKSQVHRQNMGRREGGLKKEETVDEKKISRERELLFKYEKWMSDKGWIRTYRSGGDWERSRIEKKGNVLERAQYYDKYREWEIEDISHRDINRGRSCYREAKINSRSYEYMPGPKENWYMNTENTSQIGDKTSGRERSRHFLPNKLSSNQTNYSSNERDRSPVKRVFLQMKSARDWEHLSSTRLGRGFTRKNNWPTLEEGQYHSMAVKSEINTTEKSGDNSSVESGEIPSSSKSKQMRLSDSSPQLKSNVGFISTERMRRSPEKPCDIQRPCDFYQKGNCMFVSWHNDRSQCCRLHVCAFCFYQDEDLFVKGTPTLNEHRKINCPRYIDSVKQEKSKVRAVSVDRCHGNKIVHKINEDHSVTVIKPRCQSLDRRFGEQEDTTTLQLDIEANNIKRKIYTHSKEDAKDYMNSRNETMKRSIQNEKDPQNSNGCKKNIEEISDTDDSDSFSDTDDESEESTDESRKSDKSESSSSDSDDSDQEDRITLLEAVIENVSKLNNRKQTDGGFRKDQKRKKFKVLVSGLKPEVSEDDIVTLFSTIGKLEEAKLEGNGKAEVVFTNIADAIIAVGKFHNKCLDGKIMNCKLQAASEEYKEIEHKKNRISTEKRKGNTCQMLSLRNGQGNDKSLLKDHAKEKKISFSKDQKHETISDTEEKVAVNSHGKEGNKNKAHEDMIDLNISQDLFKSASTQDLAPAENLQESDKNF